MSSAIVNAHPRRPRMHRRPVQAARHERTPVAAPLPLIRFEEPATEGARLAAQRAIREVRGW